MGLWAIGTKLKRNGTEIALVTNISPPETSVDTQDATTLSSVDGFEEVLPTIIRSGDSNIGLLLDPTDTGQKQFLTDLESRDLVDYEIEFPAADSDSAGETYPFSAYVTGFAIGEITPDGLLTATVTLKATGEHGFGGS